MPRGHLFQVLPLWLIFVGTMVLVLLSIYGGVFLARFRRKRWATDEGASISAILGATASLFTFILAFTFGLAASRFDARRTLLLDEVNAIGTAFLRTRLIPEPHASQVRALLREYVDLRVRLDQHPEDLAAAIQKSEQLQGLMWPHAAALAEMDLKNNPVAALFVASLNEMFDLQTKRVTVSIVYQMPTVIWTALFALMIFAMLAVGYLLGMSNPVNWLLVLTLSLSLSTVVLLIADLDRGAAGYIRVEAQPMLDLQRWIQGQRGAG